jgi:hypothetical protein
LKQRILGLLPSGGTGKAQQIAVIIAATLEKTFDEILLLLAEIETGINEVK